MIEQGRILEDEEFNVGGLAPSFMPEFCRLMQPLLMQPLF